MGDHTKTNFQNCNPIFKKQENPNSHKHTRCFKNTCKKVTFGRCKTEFKWEVSHSFNPRSEKKSSASKQSKSSIIKKDSNWKPGPQEKENDGNTNFISNNRI